MKHADNHFEPVVCVQHICKTICYALCKVNNTSETQYRHRRTSVDKCHEFNVEGNSSVQVQVGEYISRVKSFFYSKYCKTKNIFMKMQCGLSQKIKQASLKNCEIVNENTVQENLEGV